MWHPEFVHVIQIQLCIFSVRLVFHCTTELPFPDQAIDRVACDAPFGMSYSDKETVKKLYPQMLRGMDRYVHSLTGQKNVTDFHMIEVSHNTAFTAFTFPLWITVNMIIVTDVTSLSIFVLQSTEGRRQGSHSDQCTPERLPHRTS